MVTEFKGLLTERQYSSAGGVLQQILALRKKSDSVALLDQIEAAKTEAKKTFSDLWGECESLITNGQLEEVAVAVRFFAMQVLHVV